MAGKRYCKVAHKWCKFCKKDGCTYTIGFPQYWCTVKSCPKRDSKRTVSLKELIKTTNFYDVMTSMIKYHPTQKKNIMGYAHVYEILLEKKPKQTNMELVAHLETYSDGTCVCVYGRENGREYACEFVPWDVWLCMNIDKTTLDTLPKEDIIAGALFEMTYNGYDEETIDERKRKLESAFEECMEQEKNKK